MKRLIKASNIDYNSFVYNHVESNISSSGQIKNVIAENPDCLYSGEVYRAIYFYKDDIVEAFEECMVKEGDKLEDLSKSNYLSYYVYKAMKELIRIDDVYQSFSKTLSGVVNFTDHMNQTAEPDDVEIIISLNISDALDLSKLVNKYKNDLSEETLEVCDYFNNQEEVLGIINDDYRVIDYGSIKKALNIR